MLRVLNELLFSLRRDGFVISTAQALDAARVTEILGYDDRDRLADGLTAVVVERASDIRRFRASFDDYFRLQRGHPGDLFGRLRFRGFDDAELSMLRDLLHAVAERSGEAGDAMALRALRGTPGELDHLLSLAGVRRVLSSMQSPLQTGFFTQRVFQTLGVGRAARALSRIRQALIEGLGDRGGELGQALEEELEALERRVREHVERSLQMRDGPSDEGPKRAETAPFAGLSLSEVAEVRRAVRRLAERLRGAERVRRRRARRGKLDVRRTLRRALATGGIPFAPARRRRRRDKPRLIVVCDVSESVRAASRFMLEFVAQVQELFHDARSFVFVSEVSETTDLFNEASPSKALAIIASGSVVSVSSNSNYGRALRSLESLLEHDLDKRTTIVILGDGRTNHHDAEVPIVRRLRDRSRGLLWLCPESPSHWGTGDSAMRDYQAASTLVLPVRTARELELAARTIVHFR